MTGTVIFNQFTLSHTIDIAADDAMLERMFHSSWQILVRVFLLLTPAVSKSSNRPIELGSVRCTASSSCG